MNATINAIGIYHPEREILNSYFESIINTSDEWIRTRTGIERRFYTADDEFTCDLCVKAARNLSRIYNKDLSDVDFIIVATSTANHSIPSVASQVQAELNIPNAGSTDVTCACAGFTNGIIIAKGLIAAETHKKVLVIGVDTLSKVTDFTDRASCILFGDGAGAVIVEASEENHLFNAVTGTNGRHGKDLYLAHQDIILNGTKVNADSHLHQNGKAVYKWAVQNVVEGVTKLAEKNNVPLPEVDYIIPHSANYRMLEAIFNELKVSMSKCLDSVKQFGNTSAASVPLAWYQGIKDGRLKVGNNVIAIGFGGGLTYGGIYLNNQIARKEGM